MVADKTSVEFMKEYLRYVIAFEKSVYIWSNSLHTADTQEAQLSSQKRSLERDIQTIANTLSTIDEDMAASIEQKKKEIERCRAFIKKARRPQIIFSCVFISIWIAAALAAFYFVDISVAAIVSLAFVAIAIVKWSWGSSTSGQIYSAQQKLAEYTEELKNSTEQSQARRQKVLLSDRANKLRSVFQNTTAQLSVATSNKNKISNVYEKAKKTLSNIYALDVLPYKYRSLNAAATLYEYLDTGRCTIIQGHGGIYDTYEYDLKLGLIISKLDDIIDHLERIESHQRMLYCELKTANDSISSINKELCSFHNSFNDYAAASMEMKRQESAAVQWMAWNQWHNS